MNKRPLYQALASKVAAFHNCNESGNWTWMDKHEDDIEKLIDDHFPHGSGFDGKTELNIYESNGERLVIDSEYHILSEHGYYVGWVEFTVIVTPSLHFGFNVRMAKGKFGSKYQDIKEYILEIYSEKLGIEV